MDIWQKLKGLNRPILIYGMGNGAEKVLDACAQYKIPIAGIFASDDFVRYQTFRGYTVKRYADLIEELGSDLVILIAFSAFTDELLDRIHTLCEKHTVYAPDFDVFTSRYPEADFIESNRAALEQAYALLSDDRSREVFRQLTAGQIRPVLLQPHDAPGVKGFQTVHTLVAVQHFADSLRQFRLVAVFRLQLYDEGCLAVVQGQHIHEFRDGLIGTFQSVIFQFFGGQILNVAAFAGGPVQKAVVDDRQIAVLQQMDIQLNAVAVVQSSLESGHGIFGNAVSMKTPVGISPALEVLQPRMTAAAADGEEVDCGNNQKKFQHDFNSLICSIESWGSIPAQSSMSKASRPFLPSTLLSPCLTKAMVMKEANAKIAE